VSVGLVLAFLAWIYVFKRGFETGWIRGAGIALLTIIVFVIIGVVIALFTHLDLFMLLSFLTLSVIPSLKLTDKGLLDIEKFQLTNLWVQY
jgi:Adenine deaminase C-terminal domain